MHRILEDLSVKERTVMRDIMLSFLGLTPDGGFVEGTNPYGEDHPVSRMSTMILNDRKRSSVGAGLFASLRSNRSLFDGMKDSDQLSSFTRAREKGTTAKTPRSSKYSVASKPETHIPGQPL